MKFNLAFEETVWQHLAARTPEALAEAVNRNVNSVQAGANWIQRRAQITRDRVL